MIQLAEWWSSQQAGLVGGLGGALMGLAGAGIGLAAWALVPKGRGGPIVIGTMLAIAGFGVVAAGLGVVAITRDEPRHVWYPLVHLGLMSSLLFGGLAPVMRARYRQAERRRLEAEAIRRGAA